MSQRPTSNDTGTNSDANNLLPADRILLWFGNQCTRFNGQELGRGARETFRDYFSRWIAMKGLRLEWSVEIFPAAPPDKRVICRPIGRHHLDSPYPLSANSASVNGTQLPSCYVGEGANEEIAKEASCKSLVEAFRCVSYEITLALLIVTYRWA